MECSEIYTVELEISSLFTYFHCSCPSHNSETISKLSKILPKELPKVFAWLCCDSAGEPQDVKLSDDAFKTDEEISENAEKVINEKYDGDHDGKKVVVTDKKK